MITAYKSGRPLVAPTVNIKISCRDRRPRRSATQANNFCRGDVLDAPQINKSSCTKNQPVGEGQFLRSKFATKRSGVCLHPPENERLPQTKKRVIHTSPEKQTLIAYKGGRTKFAPTNIKKHIVGATIGRPFLL